MIPTTEARLGGQAMSHLYIPFLLRNLFYNIPILKTLQVYSNLNLASSKSLVKHKTQGDITISLDDQECFLIFVGQEKLVPALSGNSQKR